MPDDDGTAWDAAYAALAADPEEIATRRIQTSQRLLVQIRKAALLQVLYNAENLDTADQIRDYLRAEIEAAS